MELQSTNRFNIEMMKELGGDLGISFKWLVSVSNPNLAQIDIMTKLIRNENYNLNEFGAILIKSLKGSDFGFGIIFKESPTPVNVFCRIGKSF